MERSKLTITVIVVALAVCLGVVLHARAEGAEVNCTIPNNVVCQVTDPDGIAAVRVTLDTAQGDIIVVDESYSCETSVSVSWDPIVPGYLLETEDCGTEIGQYASQSNVLYGFPANYTGGVRVATGDLSLHYVRDSAKTNIEFGLDLPDNYGWEGAVAGYPPTHGGEIDIVSWNPGTIGSGASLQVTDGISLTASFPAPTHDIELYREGKLVDSIRNVPDGTQAIMIPESWCEIFELLFECVPTFSFHPDPFHGETYYKITFHDILISSYSTSGRGNAGAMARAEVDEIRFIANPDTAGPFSSYERLEVRTRNIDAVEVYGSALVPPTLPENNYLPLMQGPGGDPFGLDELTTFMEEKQPIGSELIISDDLVVEVVAEGTLIDEPAEDPVLAKVPDEGTPTPEEPPAGNVPIGRQRLRVFNTDTKQEFEIVVGGDLLQTLHRMTTAKSASGASVPGATGVDAAYLRDAGRDSASQRAPDSLSDGFDNRNLLTSTTAWPWRAIVHFSNGCSGTLVGPRHILTSAHCVVQRGTNNWYSFTVSPGRNGANKPYGDSVMSPNPQAGDPFRWYFTPAEYRSAAYSPANCAAPCWPAFQWDWALIVIPEHLGYQTGWMGYVARPASQLNPQYHLNRGYPVCNGGANAPDPCVPASLYGDSGDCDLGNYSALGSDGWNRIIRHDCDTSGGHSGSAVYHYFYDSYLGQTVPVVAMVHGWGHCAPCDASDDVPNSARRLRPADVNIISFFRNWKP